jgi:cysteine synthase
MEKESKNFNTIFTFLDSVLDKTVSYAHHMDNQIQILVGISSAVFVFAATQFSEKGDLFLLVLATFSIISAIVALLAIHPPFYEKKRAARKYNVR